MTDEGGTAGPLRPRLGDEPVEPEVLEEVTRYRGSKWDVITELVRLADGQQVRRDVVVHPGAVGVVAIDGPPGQERVLLIRQYRHPVRSYLWEVPAGLLDDPLEQAADAARRELAEEAHVVARRWHTLLDLYSSPGMSAEAYRIFLAEGVTAVPEAQRHVRTEEEAGLLVGWFPLDEAVAAVRAGQVQNAMAVAGLLAVSAARADGWTSLRSADANWPQRPRRWRPHPVA
jgi:ADP-ribose pyrophosphatase